MNRDDILRFCQTLAGASCDCPFEDFDGMVLRHADTGKWFGLLMTIEGERIGRSGRADVLNVKTPPELSGVIRESKKWILPAYHMNKTHWNSLVLSEAEEAETKKLLRLSFDITAGKPKQRGELCGK